METLFEAQKIYEAGRRDEAEYLNTLFVTKAPHKTVTAQFLTNKRLIEIDFGRINLVGNLKTKKRKPFWRRLWA